MSIVYTIGTYARTTESGGIRFLYLPPTSLDVNAVAPFLIGGAAYNVPSGKKFIVTEARLVANNGTAAITHSASSTSSGTEILSVPKGFEVNFPVYYEVPSNRYFVAVNTFTMANHVSGFIYGIEVDA